MTAGEKCEEGQLRTCTKDRFCWVLENRLQEANAWKKGFSCLVLTNMKTGEGRCAGVNYKESSKDGGLLMRYCPWCGTNFYELFDAKAKKEEPCPTT